MATRSDEGIPRVVSNESDIARRAFLKRAAIVSLSAPAVVSVFASPAFANHIPVGNSCSQTTPHCVAGAGPSVVVCRGEGTLGVNTCGYASGSKVGTANCNPNLLTGNSGQCCSKACSGNSCF